MEYDEKTRSYRYNASDITSDDIVDWLEDHPVAEFRAYTGSNPQEMIRGLAENHGWVE